jgi:hypothetical protein
VLGVPALRDLFHFAPVAGADVLLAIGAGLGGIVWFELFKLLRRPRLA